jgi:hypothetical protein
LADFETMIRDKLADGTLPKEDCRMTWYGPGTNGICVACDRLIAENEVEVECDLGVGGVIRLHQRCYEFWMREWRSE